MLLISRSVLKKKQKIHDLKKKQDLLALRLSLLTNELTKQLVLKVEDNKEEREILEKAKQVGQSFKSPAEAISASLSELSNEAEVSTKKMKQTMQTVIK